MTDNIYLFCDVGFSNRLPLEKYLNPLLARLPEEKRKLLAPNGVKERTFEYVKSHSIFCRFKKTCTCEKEKSYDYAQFVLSDRRPVQPYTREIADEFHHHGEGWGGDQRLANSCAWRYGIPWGSGRIWNLEWAIISTEFEPSWRHTWDPVTVTEHEHSKQGATLWQPIGNGLYEWAHVSTFGRRSTGLGRIAWDAEGNGRLFRVTEH